MNKKIVFFDIDGTLRYINGKIPQSTIDGIRQLRKNGHLAIVCSGRGRSMILDEIIDIGFDGVIASCSSYIEYHGEVICDNKVDKKIALLTYHALKKYKVNAFLEGTEVSYLCEFAGSGRDSVFFTLIKDYMDGEVFYAVEESPFNKFMCSLDGDTKGLMKELEPFYNVIHHGNYFEFIPKGLTKAIGVNYMLKYLNIPYENSYAFGDSENDLEMLLTVKYGIAMGNATEHVRETAKYHTTLLEEDGIVKGLKSFDLI